MQPVSRLGDLLWFARPCLTGHRVWRVRRSRPTGVNATSVSRGCMGMLGTRFRRGRVKISTVYTVLFTRDSAVNDIEMWSHFCFVIRQILGVRTRDREAMMTLR